MTQILNPHKYWEEVMWKQVFNNMNQDWRGGTYHLLTFHKIASLTLKSCASQDWVAMVKLTMLAKCM